MSLPRPSRRRRATKPRAPLRRPRRSKSSRPWASASSLPRPRRRSDGQRPRRSRPPQCRICWLVRRVKKRKRERERERERERKREPSIRRLATACFPPPPSAFLLSLLLFALPLAHLVPFHTTIRPFGTNRQGRHRPRADRERQDGRLRPAHSSGKRMTHASLFFPQAKHRAAATAPTSDRNLLLPPFPPLSTPSHLPTSPPPPNETK